jgi:hypothetical protein
VNPARSFVLELSVYSLESKTTENYGNEDADNDKGDYRLFLFNDLLLCTREPRKKGKKLEYVTRIMMNALRVTDFYNTKPGRTSFLSSDLTISRVWI